MSGKSMPEQIAILPVKGDAGLNPASGNIYIYVYDMVRNKASSKNEILRKR